MSKAILKLIIFILVIFTLSPSNVFAQNVSVQCDKFPNYVIPAGANFPAQANLGEAFDITVKFGSVADTRFNYYIKLTQHATLGIGNIDVRTSQQNISRNNLQATFRINASGLNSNESTIGNFTVYLMHSEDRGEQEVCRLGNINFVDQTLNSTQCNIKMPNNVGQDQQFFYNIEKNDPPGINFFLYFFRAHDMNPGNLWHGIFSTRHPLATWDRPEFAEMYRGVFPNNATPIYKTRIGSNTSAATPPNLGYTTMTYDNSGSNRLNGGDYAAVLEAARDSGGGSSHFFCNYHRFIVSTEATSELTDGTPITQPGQGGVVGGGEFTTETCLDRKRKDINVKCTEAAAKPCDDDPKNPGIQTAIGCIHTSPAGFTKDFLGFAIGISGGLAFLMMLLGAFQMLTSAGNPDTLHAGRERLTSAVIGLLFVIFALLLLQIIGIGILDIPGFVR